MNDILWCCHVRGPDDMWPAPDYKTALAWADICLKIDRRPGRTENNPFLSAVPSPWPYSAEAHADGLPKAVNEFVPAASKVASIVTA